MKAALALFLMAVVFLICNPFASPASLTISPETLKVTSNSIINLSVTPNSIENISQFNVTMPIGFSFIDGTNVTTSNSTFYNSSNNLVWTNITAHLILNGFTSYFWFNATTSDSIGNYTFNATYRFSNSSTAITAVNITLTKNPILDFANVSPDPGGWGETFNFSVRVTDVFDNDTILLWARSPPATGNWLQIGSSQICQNCSNQTVFWNTTFPCTNIGTWEFKYNASDTEGNVYESSVNNSGYSNNSAEDDQFTIEKDDVSIELVNNNLDSFAWRNGSSYANLTIRLVDLDNGSSVANQPWFGAFYVTRNSSDNNSWDNGKNKTATISMGSNKSDVEYLFISELPTGRTSCDYSVGFLQWKGGPNGTPCYKDTNSTNYTLELRSELRPFVFHPGGHNYIGGGAIGGPVPTNGTINDDCGIVENATVTYNYYNGSSYYGAASLRGQCGISSSGSGTLEFLDAKAGNGWYNCTWSTSGKFRGWYNVSMDVSKTHYGSNSTRKNYAFQLGTRPSLSNFNVDKQNGAWGSQWTFSYDITDSDGNVNNITLWKSYNNSTWFLVDWQQKQPQPTLSGQQFIETFSCDDYIYQSSIIYMKLEANDTLGLNTTIYLESSETNKNVTLSKDNLSLEYSTSNYTDSRRFLNNETNFSIRILDITNGSYIAGVNATLNISSNSTDNSLQFNCTSDSSGYCTIQYNPTCNSTVGIKSWIGSVVSSSCRSGNNTLGVSFLNIIGYLPVNLTSPQSNQTLTRGLSYAFTSNTITDDCGLGIDGSSISWYNGTRDLLATGNNTSWIVPVGYKNGVDTLNVTTVFYDGYYRNVLIYGWSEPYSILPTNNSKRLVGDVVNISCSVRDSNNSGILTGYPVNWTKNGVFQQTNLTTNITSSFFWNTTSEPSGIYNMTCSISSNSSLFYNASAPSLTTFIRLVNGILSFSNITLLSSTVNMEQNATYAINVSLRGTGGQLTYNLSTSTGGLNASQITINSSSQSPWAIITLSVSNSAAGTYVTNITAVMSNDSSISFNSFDDGLGNQISTTVQSQSTTTTTASGSSSGGNGGSSATSSSTTTTLKASNGAKRRASLNTYESVEAVTTTNADEISDVPYIITVKAYLTSLGAGEDGVIIPKTGQISIKKMTIQTEENTSGVEIYIIQVPVRPYGVAEPSSHVYRYFNITSNNLDKITKAFIEFEVSNKWIINNNRSDEDIKMLHFSNGSWDELFTKKLGNHDDYTAYESFTGGFSPFAIAFATNTKYAGEIPDSVARVEHDMLYGILGFVIGFLVFLIAYLKKDDLNELIKKKSRVA